MPGELAALGTGVFTNVTFVGFFSRVGSDVNGEVGGVLKHFPAVSAGVVPLNVLQGLDAAFLGNLSEETGLHGRQRRRVQHRLVHVVLHGVE